MPDSVRPFSFVGVEFQRTREAVRQASATGISTKTEWQRGPHREMGHLVRSRHLVESEFEDDVLLEGQTITVLVPSSSLFG